MSGISFKPCGGLGGKVKLEAFFTSPDIERTYTVEGGDLSSPITITSTNSIEFVENLSAGSYIAKMLYQGEELVDSFDIINATMPQVSFSPSTICSGQSSVLTVTGVAGASFTVTKSGGATNIVTIGINGTGTLPGITIGGEYTITANSSATGQCYPFTTSVELTVGGQSLTPTITLQPGNYCVGQVIPFRIEDGGINATYTVSSLGSGTISATVVASMTDFNGTFTPNTTSGAIKVTGVTDTCNTTTTPQISVTSTTEPTLTGLVATCANDNSHTVSLTTNATTVTVEGVAATNISGQNWQRTGITGLTEADVVVTSATGCQKTQTIQLQSCSCPTGTLTISSEGDTCGQGETVLSYLNFIGATPDVNWAYQWQKMVNGSWVVVQMNAWTVDPYTAYTTLNVVDEYRLMIENTVNSCKYYSESTFVTAILPPSATITPSISPIIVNQPVSFSTENISGRTYLWSGAYIPANVTTATTPSITPTAEGNATVNVEVCQEDCCTDVAFEYTVIPIPCGPTVSPIITVTSTAHTDSCNNIVFNLASGAPGQVCYTVTSNQGEPINISNTCVNVPSGNITIDMSSVPVGWNGIITITATGSNGCITTQTVNYSRCTIPPITLDYVSVISTCSVKYTDGWELGYSIHYTLGCISLLGQPLYFVWEKSHDGDPWTALSNYGITVPTNATCSSMSSTSAISSYNLSFSSGVQEVQIRVTVYLGNDDQGILLGTETSDPYILPVC